MGRLIVGFDSAWTRTNTGAIVGAVVDDRGPIRGLGPPQLVRYQEATEILSGWQRAHLPSSTLVLLDQPTIVANSTGQRPVEHIVCSAVSRRRGGMQPANKGRVDMFGALAPVWEFLAGFGGWVDPFARPASTQVFETYPVLAMIALGWTLPDPERPAGRLPKYNPERRTTFAVADWVHVCRTTAATLGAEGAAGLAAWTEIAASNPKPTKNDQDRLDACICLLVALHLVKGRDALFVGCCTTGYIVVPNSDPLRNELATRCTELGRDPSDWVRVFRSPDGHGRLELTKFRNPKLVEIEPAIALPNTLGLRSVMFTVESVDDAVARLRANGAELVGEVAQYEDKYRLCYMRGPAGIIVALAEEL